MIRREARQRRYYGLVIKPHYSNTLRKHFLTMTRSRVETAMIYLEQRIQQFKEKNGDTA